MSTLLPPPDPVTLALAFSPPSPAADRPWPQALGDADALAARGRRVLRVGLGPDAVAGLRAAEAALARSPATGG